MRAKVKTYFQEFSEHLALLESSPVGQWLRDVAHGDRVAE